MKPTIGFIPGNSSENLYARRMMSILSGIGNTEGIRGNRALLRNLLRGNWFCYDYIFMSWLENKIIDTRGSVSMAGIVKLLLELILIRLNGKQTIFVRHNWFPHHANPNAARIARMVVNILEKCVSQVIVHSGDEEAVLGRHYCPHPLYERVQPIPRVPDDCPWSEDYYVVFGRIAAYKKIIELINTFPDNQRLLIIGGPGEPDYVDQVKRRERENIKVVARFVSEAEAQRVLLNSNGAVLSHADTDMVVSGSFFYALSIGCPLYAISTPFTKWVYDHVGQNKGITIAQDLHALNSLLASTRRCAAPGSWVEQMFGDASVAAHLNALLLVPQPQY